MTDLERIPYELKQKLDSESLFATLNVTTEDKLEVSSDIAAQLVALTAKGGKVGAGLVISKAKPVFGEPNVMGPELRVRVACSLFECKSINRDARMNGTLITGRQWAIDVIRTLHQFALEGLCTGFYPDPQIPWQESDDFIKHGYETLDFWLLTALPLTAIPQVPIPNLAENAGTITLTGIAGSDVYFTTDATGAAPGFPGPGNAAATPYAAPFAVTAGTAVRWAAYKAGMRGSDIAQAIIN